MKRRRLPNSMTVHPMARIDTRKWRTFTAKVLREPGEQVCWLRLPGCTVRSTTLDHVIPRSHRPDLTYERFNVRGACKRCNERRGNTPMYKLPALRDELARKAKPAKALGFLR